MNSSVGTIHHTLENTSSSHFPLQLACTVIVTCRQLRSHLETEVHHLTSITLEKNKTSQASNTPNSPATPCLNWHAALGGLTVEIRSRAQGERFDYFTFTGSYTCSVEKQRTCSYFIWLPVAIAMETQSITYAGCTDELYVGMALQCFFSKTFWGSSPSSFQLVWCIHGLFGGGGFVLKDVCCPHPTPSHPPLKSSSKASYWCFAANLN